MARLRDSRGRFVKSGGSGGRLRDAQGRFVKGGSTGGWEGLETLEAEHLLSEMQVDAERALMQGLVIFASELKKTLTGTRSGKAYPASKRGPAHIASAPGEPPAVASGNLRNSVSHTLPKWEGSTVSGEVGIGLGVTSKGKQSGASYARRLEFGGIHTQRTNQAFKTMDGWRMVKAGTVIRILPRPYMEPTALRMEPILDKLFERFTV
jgi:hypothetical protein